MLVIGNILYKTASVTSFFLETLLLRIKKHYYIVNAVHNYINTRNVSPPRFSCFVCFVLF